MKRLIISHALSPARMRLTHVEVEAQEILGHISAPRWSLLHTGIFDIWGEWSCVLEALKCLLF